MSAGETGRFDAHQVEVATKIARIETQVEEIKRQQQEHDGDIAKQNTEIARITGLYEGAIPDMQQKLEKVKDHLDSRDETAQIYYNQIREMSSDFEQMSAHCKELKAAISALATKSELQESSKHIMLFVKLGWLAVGAALLGAVVKELLILL
jgi:peptidoglycan hydrolase CwlO-like protein